MTPRQRPLDPDWVEARLHRDAARELHADIAPDFTPALTTRERLIARIVLALVVIICALPFIGAAFATLRP